MASLQQSPFVASALRTAAHCGHILSDTFLSPGSTFSLLSLGAALAISIAFLVWRRARKRRGLHVAQLARALLPRRLWASASTRADLGFFLLNSFATASLIGWALISSGAIGRATQTAMTELFGAAPDPHLSPILRDGLLTLVLFLAYDLAYWVDHFLKHKVPLFWEFHRVHHTAEVLSPLTIYRMHPVDSLIFYNIVAAALGVTNGIATHLLGSEAQQASLSGNNVILVVFIFTTIHLQHSRIDIRFRGWLGKLLFSPAHHHIHHSTRREHFDSNLASCLAIWDWIFGTLILPDDVEGRLTFGADTEGDRYTPHSMAGSLVWPFVRAFRTLMPRTGRAAETRAYDTPG